MTTRLNEVDHEYISTVYRKATKLLNHFFEQYGGRTGALKFLSAYNKENQCKHVDSDIFGEYLEEYNDGSQKNS